MKTQKRTKLVKAHQTKPAGGGIYPVAVVVYGPAACGKTHNKEYLRGVFRKRRVVDDPSPGRPFTNDELILCNDYNDVPWKGKSVLIISFEEAMALR